MRRVKFVAPVAALLLIFSGCGSDSGKTPPGLEEIRHPSNEMNPPQKVEPEPPDPKKRAKVKRVPAKPPERVYEDPRRIPAGIEYSEMVRRFGPPSMKVTDTPLRTTFAYSRLKTQVQVEVQNGKVVAVASINTGF